MAAEGLHRFSRRSTRGTCDAVPRVFSAGCRLCTRPRVRGHHAVNRRYRVVPRADLTRSGYPGPTQARDSQEQVIMPRERYFSVETLVRLLCAVDESVSVPAIKRFFEECPPSVDVRCLLLEYAISLTNVLSLVFKGFTQRLLLAARHSLILALSAYCPGSPQKAQEGTPRENLDQEDAP